MPKDLGAIKRLIGPRKRHVSLSVEAAKEIKRRPIDGDFEPLLDETRETRDHLQQHLAVYEDLRQELEDAAIKAGKTAHETVMADYEEYMELVFEAEELVVGLSSKMEMIKDRMDCNVDPVSQPQTICSVVGGCIAFPEVQKGIHCSSAC